MNVPTILPARLDELCRTGAPVELIDVRTPAEYQEVHVPVARNVPLDRLDPDTLLNRRQGAPGQPLYVICRSGSRAEQACRRLLAARHGDVVSVEGGMLAWDNAGLPVVRGKKAMSLERQVRIAIGAMVLIGAALTLVVDSWFVGICAFLGAGLIFSGVTDTCGLAMILARMPWNQAGPTAGAAAPTCCVVPRPR